MARQGKPDKPARSAGKTSTPAGKGRKQPAKRAGNKTKSRANGKTKSTAGGAPRKQNRRKLSAFLFKLCVLGVVAFAGWLVYLDAVVRDKFEGKMWSIPASVYARPLELYQGAALNPDLLDFELKALGYRHKTGRIETGQYTRQGARFTIAIRPFRFAEEWMPARSVRLEIQGDTIQTLRQTTGQPLDLVRLEPLKIGGIYPRQKEDRILVRLDQVPESLVTALTTIEDKNFWHHHGIAPLSILRALWVNLSAGKVKQGGSTLTQQLVKNFYLDSRRTLFRKVQEALMSVLLELHYSKEQILEAYINEIYLGQSGNRAIHGFAMGSQFYFAKPLQSLNQGELALLVAMVKGPSFYNPRRNPQRARERRNLVLGEMARAGAIEPREAKKIQHTRLRVAERPSFSENLYPAFMDLIRRQLATEYKQEDLESEGLRIFTTLDPQVQHQAENAVRRTMKRLDPSGKKHLQAAMLVTGAESAEVKAIIGDRKPRYAGFNRALDAERPIGSLIKPAVFLTALQHESRYNLNTTISDQPITIELDNKTVWTPQNFEKRSFGNVTLHYALTHSLNISTARLGLSLGVDEVIETLDNLGVDSSALTRYPSLFLGATSMSPWQVTKLYQTIAASGFNLPVRSIRAVATPGGHVLSRYAIDVEQRIDPKTMHLLHYMLQEVMREGTGKSAYSRLPAKLSVAGKTGTTNDHRDSWFAGMTGDYLGIAWIGRDDNGPTRLTGATGALKLWTNTMSRLPQRPFSPVVPDGVEYEWVLDGRPVRTDEGCEGARYLPYIQGTEPTRKQGCLSGIRKIGKWFETIFD
ncbi:MAG: penicillin-binding protein 1B [Gammaproteobacteria bacterium]|nr:MAG: penicillin-binding protein 1B [Pseudomonadota bacterium]PIE38589.1 MAG: penicillin-binding protein 1B [Gammaproteobacteria bacterium]